MRRAREGFEGGGVIREARSWERKDSLKKKKKQPTNRGEVGAGPRKEWLSVWDAKKFTDKAGNRFPDLRTLRTLYHRWYSAGQFHYKRPLLWREN